jgi:iron-sulfur cluster repair protein YtfE (RIC family)
MILNLQEGAMPPIGDAAFWSFMATMALIVQMVLQRYYARKAAESAAVIEKATKVAAETASKAAVKVEEVKAVLQVSNINTESTLQGIVDTGDRNHTLLNSGMGKVLAKVADLAEIVANLRKLPEDIEVAQAARQASDKHEARQAKVDKKDAKDAKDMP